uniref:Guanylate kinase n=1 Tax=Tetraselmis sp. GSL018 TaxID=582737 RepID=A0A061RPK5_9CHLO
MSVSASAEHQLQALESEFGKFSTAPQHKEAPVVVVISGPSGVGKDAAIRRLQESRDDFHFVVTATSVARKERERLTAWTTFSWTRQPLRNG